MSAFGAFLGRLSRMLDDAGIPYMYCGSLASTYHGMPRATQDVDVVVALAGASLSRLLQSLPEDAYYVSASAAHDALRRGGQFNIIDLDTGWKADLIVQKRRPFSVLEFDRRIRGEIAGVEVWLTTAEDTVISKLEWAARSGGSERQIRDVQGVVDRAGASLDVDHVRRWVGELGLDAQWQKVVWPSDG